jgi:hypothetical protein
LFSEFKDHFEQMGEKSFDHTKKYWFNKLRRRFPIPLEVKTEKVHIANPLAEQTITESLIEPGTVATQEDKKEIPTEEPQPPTTETPAPKIGFKPRFNAGMIKPKPVENETPAEKKEEVPAEDIQPPVAGTPVSKMGFKPRFNAAMMKPKPAESEEPVEEKKEEVPAEEPSATEAPTPKLGFKPRFNAKNLPKKSEGEE